MMDSFSASRVLYNSPAEEGVKELQYGLLAQGQL